MPALGSVARAVVLRALRQLPGGRIDLVENGVRHELGQPAGPGELTATITVHDRSIYGEWLRGSVAFADSYVDGRWDVDDMVTLIRIAARSMGAIDGVRGRVAGVAGPARRALAARRTNNRTRSRSNVEEHYDLGNDFFSLVLDETMGYACAYWERPDMASADAARANYARVCRLLDLKPGERLLEMGSGWGGLAVYAAQYTGCHVSAVTLSHNQREYIERLAAQRGVADRVQVLVSDYRDVRGSWDKIVSLEMVESIGAQHLKTFLRCCGELMRPDGLMLMQAITTHDRLFRIDRYSRTFLNQRIFPNGCAPSLEVILDASASQTNLRCVAVHDISPHYPPTLRVWRERLQLNWPQIAELGDFDESFRRLWFLYFSYCEAGFLERRVMDRQLLLAGPAWRDENRLLGDVVEAGLASPIGADA